jgi:hypothetical protein
MGFDEVMKNLNDLAENPQQLLEGQTFETQQEVECEHCGEKFEVTVSVRILKVVGNKGFGPGYSTKEECPSCGELNKYEWDQTVATIEIS